MQDAYQLYQATLDKINKDENGYFKANHFNRLAAVASRDTFNRYQTIIQSPEAARQIKQETKDRLLPFTKSAMVSMEAGIFSVPEDYAYFNSCRMINDDGGGMVLLNHYNSLLCEAENDPTINVAEVQAKIDDIVKNPDYVSIDLLDAEQVAKRLKSFIPGKRPSASKPIMERIEGGMQVYPGLSASIFLQYYRRPVPGKLVMMVDEDTQDLVYDIDNSIGFEWTDESLNDIILKIAKDWSIYVREKDLFQMTEVEQNKK